MAGWVCARSPAWSTLQWGEGGRHEKKKTTLEWGQGGGATKKITVFCLLWLTDLSRPNSTFLLPCGQPTEGNRSTATLERSGRGGTSKKESEVKFSPELNEVSFQSRVEQSVSAKEYFVPAYQTALSCQNEISCCELPHITSSTPHTRQPSLAKTKDHAVSLDMLCSIAPRSDKRDSYQTRWS